MEMAITMPPLKDGGGGMVCVRDWVGRWNISTFSFVSIHRVR